MLADRETTEQVAKSSGSLRLTAPGTQLLQHRLLVLDFTNTHLHPAEILRLLCFSLHIRQLLRNDEFYACTNTRRER